MKNIIPLKKEFVGRGEVKGFNFSQISKTNWGFLYEVNTGHTIYYEVFQKRVNRRFACVVFPTSRAFGIYAWTTPDLNRAYEILSELDLTQDLSINNIGQ